MIPSLIQLIYAIQNHLEMCICFGKIYVNGISQIWAFEKIEQVPIIY